MQCHNTAESVDTSAFRPFNTKEQFNGAGIVGYSLFGRIVPVVFDLILSNDITKKVIIQDDSKRYHRCFFYDEVKMSACCRTILKFNISHYIKCYLPSSLGTNMRPTTPYVMNYCEKCNVGVTDDCGNSIAYSQWRQWHNGIRAWKAEHVVQNCDNDSPLCYPLQQEEKEITYNKNGAAVNVATSNKKPCKCGGH